MNISMSRLLLIAAAAFALLTAAVVGYLSWSQPLHLRVAAGPKDGIDAKLLIAFNRLLDVNRAGARLDLVTTADMHESSQLLEKREVDLAVLRLDDPLPTGAALVAMLRTNLMIAAAPARLKLETLADVKGKRLGLVSRSPLDEPSFVRLLDMVGLTPADVRMTIIKPEDVARLVAGGQLDCVVVLGVPADPVVRDVVAAVGDKRKTPPTILSIELGESLKQNTPAASSETIEKNAFPRLSIPDDDVDTVGVPTALAANRASTGPMRVRLYNNAIMEVTRGLLERRSELAREIPLASLITPPDSEKDARFPLHPGTAAYLEDTDTSWSTLFSEQIWNVVLVGGVISSMLAAAGGFLNQGGADPMGGILSRLKDITERAGASTDPADAQGLSQELGVLAIDMAALGYKRRCSYEEFAPLQLAYESARDAVAALRAGPPPTARGDMASEAVARPQSLQRERSP
ncbi:TAXI family TRAP transporter solute-binding subunit [Bosea sp. 2YAB26]|uniref:TAXI family TRAP transporter solute-binding subunit n=1 Tax=Bosea sp. 2YAB26 TaxID=3237478 RepID=UPI003F90A3ED